MQALIPEISTQEPQLSGMDNLLDLTTKNIKGSVVHGLIMQADVASSNQGLDSVYIANKPALDAYFGQINMAKVWQLTNQNAALKQKALTNNYVWLAGGVLAGYVVSKFLKK